MRKRNTLESTRAAHPGRPDDKRRDKVRGREQKREKCLAVEETVAAAPAASVAVAVEGRYKFWVGSDSHVNVIDKGIELCDFYWKSEPRPRLFASLVSGPHPNYREPL
ncbi:hypothetical protein QQP08_016980 [Theobroma cacao]|nr:hypothetical protein QQP08_016980 [Theobroma cacao]